MNQGKRIDYQLLADLAEYAVKVGCSFERAERIFHRFGHGTIREFILRGAS